MTNNDNLTTFQLGIIRHIQNEMTNEEREQLFVPPPRWAATTIRKHLWVDKLYSAFCIGMSVPKFPLTEANMTSFFRYIADKDKHDICFPAIKGVVIPSLKRMHEELFGFPIDESIISTIHQVVNNMKRTGLCRDQGVVREPCTVKDVENIIKAMPNLYLEKYQEGSLFLISVNTG